MNILHCRANLPIPAILAPRSDSTKSPITDHYSSGRGGRAVDRAGLENRKAERPREFESHPLRHFNFRFSTRDLRFVGEKNARPEERTKIRGPQRIRHRIERAHRCTCVRTRLESVLADRRNRFGGGRKLEHQKMPSKRLRGRMETRGIWC